MSRVPKDALGTKSLALHVGGRQRWLSRGIVAADGIRIAWAGPWSAQGQVLKPSDIGIIEEVFFQYFAQYAIRRKYIWC